jgi:hypothetical protein
LKADYSLSNRQLHDITKADRDLISKIKKYVNSNPLQLDDYLNMDDGQLYLLIYPNNKNIKCVKPEPDVEKIIDELNSNKTLTLKQCHDEYLSMYPDGLGSHSFVKESDCGLAAEMSECILIGNLVKKCS